MSLNRHMSLLELEALLEQESRENVGQRVLHSTSLDWLSDVTLLAKKLTGMPLALVSVLDQRTTHLVAQQGATMPATPRDETLCDLVARSGRPVVIPDAAAEPSLADYPTVRLGLRSYIGVPIGQRAEPEVSFSLCVADERPQPDAGRRVEALEALARLAARTLDRETAPDAGVVRRRVSSRGGRRRAAVRVRAAPSS